MLSELGEKVSDEEKSNINQSLDKLKEALKGDDTQAIKTANEELIKSSHKLAETAYRQAAEKQAAEEKEKKEEPQKTEKKRKKGKKEEDIIDAEYKVDDEDKKKSK